MKYRTALAPTDFSPGSVAVIQLASGLAALGVKHVIAVNAFDAGSLESPVARAALKDAGRQLKETLAKVDHGDVELTGHVIEGPPARTVLAAAKDYKADLIVLGSTGKRPVAELLLGSLSEQVTRESDLPVLWVRFPVITELNTPEIDRKAKRLSDVVVHPTDFSECSGRALDAILDAEPHRVILAHAVDDAGMHPTEAEARVAEAARRLETIQRRLARCGLKASTRVGRGDPAKVLLGIVKGEKATMMVLGSRGKGLVTESILGSVSAQLLRQATVPVMVIH